MKAKKEKAQQKKERKEARDRERKEADKEKDEEGDTKMGSGDEDDEEISPEKKGPTGLKSAKKSAV